jgi:hypothetical protein
MAKTWSDLLDDERRRDAAGALAWRREAERNRGVCWSGPALQPAPRRSSEEIESAARARAQVQQAWRTSPAGRFLAAVGNAQQAAEAAHLAGESGRAAVARGFEASAAGCRRAAEALEAQAHALLSAARAAVAATNLAEQNSATSVEQAS